MTGHMQYNKQHLYSLILNHTGKERGKERGSAENKHKKYHKSIRYVFVVCMYTQESDMEDP